MDDAFRKWYPIDWGFNPFEVPEFVRMTILNHVVVGKVKQSSVKDGGILTTLGGKQIIIKKTPNSKWIYIFYKYSNSRCYKRSFRSQID